MPIYDYVCTNCGQRTEVIHAVHAPGPEGCPTCGATMRKAVSTPAIVFKGSGWAKKDARDGVRATAKAEGKAAAAQSSTAEGSSETATTATKEATSPPGD